MRNSWRLLQTSKLLKSIMLCLMMDSEVETHGKELLRFLVILRCTGDRILLIKFKTLEASASRVVAERRGVEPHLASSVRILVAAFITGKHGQSVYRSTDASYRHCLDRIFHSFSSLFITFILFRQKRNASIPVCDNNTDNTCPERNLTERNTHQENYSHRDNHQSENLADVDLQGFCGA